MHHAILSDEEIAVNLCDWQCASEGRPPVFNHLQSDQVIQFGVQYGPISAYVATHLATGPTSRDTAPDSRMG